MQIFNYVMLLAILLSLVGCRHFYKKRPRLAGRLGVAAILLGGTSFAFQVIEFSLTKEGMERVVIIGTAVLITPIIAAYWLRVWQKKRPDS
jgi:hypothetical protein